MGSNPGGGIFTEVVGWVTPVIPLRKFRQPSVARRPSGVLLVLYSTVLLQPQVAVKYKSVQVVSDRPAERSDVTLHRVSGSVIS